MTEQTTTGGAEPEVKFGPFVEDVGRFFTAFNTYQDGYECIGGDLAEEGAEEMARQFRDAEHFFEGMLYATERVSFAVYILMAEAKDRAEMARKAAERHVRNVGEEAG